MMDQEWEMRPRPVSPPRLAREHASFSAALLDAIYRSVDTNTSPGKRPDSKNSSSSSPPPAEFWREPRAASTDHDHKIISQTALALQKYPSTPRYLVPRTSRCSTPRHRPPRTNRIRPDPSLPSAPTSSSSSSSSSPPNEEAEFQLSSKDDNYKKIKLGKKKKRSIMRLLKSFFSLKRDKKALKVAQLTEPPQPAIGSSSARSCMSSRKKLSEGPKRSVRFAPVSKSSAYDDGAVEKRVEELIKALAQGRG